MPCVMLCGCMPGADGVFQEGGGPSIGGILPLVSVGQRWAQNTEKGLGGKPTVLTVGCRTQAARRAA